MLHRGRYNRRAVLASLLRRVNPQRRNRVKIGVDRSNIVAALGIIKNPAAIEPKSLIA